jgi:hypothetical protein
VQDLIQSIVRANYDLKKTTLFLTTLILVKLLGNMSSQRSNFAGKVITDLVLLINLQARYLLMMVNNLFNVYPEMDTKGDVVTDLGGRFNMHGSEPIWL